MAILKKTYLECPRCKERLKLEAVRYDDGGLTFSIFCSDCDYTTDEDEDAVNVLAQFLTDAGVDLP